MNPSITDEYTIGAVAGISSYLKNRIIIKVLAQCSVLSYHNLGIGNEVEKMFKEFSIKNYRAIDEQGLDLSLSPLTILVGPSGSGKSSFLEAVALTAQSAIEDPSRYDLVLNGSIIDIYGGLTRQYNIGKEIYNAKDVLRKLSTGFEIRIDEERWNQSGFANSPPPIIKNATTWPPNTFSYSWGRKGTDGSWKACWSHVFSVDGMRCFEIETSATDDGAPGSYITKLRLGDLSEYCGETVNLGIDFERVLHEGLASNSLINSIPTSHPQVLEIFKTSLSFLQFIRKELLAQLNKTSFLSGLRGKQLLKSESGTESGRIGQHGELAKRLLVSQRARRHPAYQKLQKWASRFNLHEIDSSLVDSNEISISFLDKATNSILEIESGAAGSIQGLLIATQILLAEPGCCHLVEEPEIHMHPQFEAELALLFANAIELGQQIIVTTHSEILISAIANAVRSKRIPSGQVSIWHLERSSTGKIENKNVEISEKGNIDGWISSFRQIEEKLFDEWTQALPVAQKKDSY